MIPSIIVNLAKRLNPMSGTDAETLQKDIENDFAALPILDKGAKPKNPMEVLGVLTRHWLFKIGVMFLAFWITRRLTEPSEYETDPEAEKIAKIADLLKSR